MKVVEDKNGGTEELWVKKIRGGDEHAFEKLFFEYFYDLCSYAFQITKSQGLAKDTVQEVFYKLWKRRDSWTVHTSLKAYLFRSVRNEALNQMNRAEHREQLREQLTIQEEGRPSSAEAEEKTDEELLKKIWEIVPQMPQRRQSVFILHRKHGLTYKEIAQVLDITRKTVENHMGLALEEIRENIDSKRL